MAEDEAGHEADWQPWLERLAAARAASAEMGGADRLERQVYAKGRLDVRQRIELLFDAGTFTEIGGLVGGREGLPADGFICGFGEIAGRPAAVGAEDFSIKAGSIGTGGHYKRHRIAELAVQEGVPVVWLLEGAGARLGARTSEPARLPNDLEPMADAKGRVPVACVVHGVSAGHGAITAPLSDFVVMTESAAIFTGGPDLVKAATGEDVTADELGGWRVAVQAAGTVHNVVPDDAAALAMVRDYLGYFPSNRSCRPPIASGPDTGPRATPELLAIIPPDSRRPYDVREVIAALVDDHHYFEVQPRYGGSISVGWARMGGRPVGIVANNPGHQAGALTAAAAVKATELIELADTFGQPVIFLIDNPGVMAGTAAERSGVLKWGGRMYLAGRRLRSPKISVLMRKGFGFGLVTMAHMPHDLQTLTLSLPSANIAAMPAQSGGRTANLDEETLARLEQAQRGGPYGLADRLGVDDVVDPRELRNVILRALAFSADRPRRTAAEE
jgi:acetyl-CoA carboxylase carboxyltransferase component